MRARLLLLSALLLVSLPGGAAAQNVRDDARSAIRRGNELYARAEYEAAIGEYAGVPREAGELYARSL
ncbi:MAG TPA: hypothetical protein VK421_07530, partial [Pyrinomonadaceae bacterium]|nr:hypothetical protein [Pyrinomonadaceae bacterium]